MSHDVKKLEAKVKQFDEKLSRLVVLSDKLIPIMHNPGWTTLPESQLVELTLDNLCHQLDNALQTQQRLVETAKLIGVKSPQPSPW